jgi:hypothetical protein
MLILNRVVGQFREIAGRQTNDDRERSSSQSHRPALKIQDPCVRDRLSLPDALTTLHGTGLTVIEVQSAGSPHAFRLEGVHCSI